MTMPATQNPDYGFFGTIATAGLDAQAYWTTAVQVIAAEADLSNAEVRPFLDSKHGRYFADSVLNNVSDDATVLNAVEAAVNEWRGWAISKATTNQFGIPAGLDYLTGWAHHELIEAENAA